MNTVPTEFERSNLNATAPYYVPVQADLRASNEVKNAEPKQRLLFDECCGCVDLRTSSLIIAYCHTIISAALAITFSILLHYDEIKGLPILPSVFAMLLSISHIVFDIIVIVGIHKNSASLLKAFLYFVAIVNTFGVMLMFFSFVTISYAISLIFLLLCVFGVNAYVMLIIRSYYKKIYLYNNGVRQGPIYSVVN